MNFADKAVYRAAITLLKEKKLHNAVSLFQRLAAQAELMDYVLQGDLNNRLTPRAVDIGYTAFMASFEQNKDDGGPMDWFNDTKPRIDKAIARIRADLAECKIPNI